MPWTAWIDWEDAETANRELKPLCPLLTPTTVFMISLGRGYPSVGECLDGHTESGCDLLFSKMPCVGLNLEVLRALTAVCVNEGFSLTFKSEVHASRKSN